MSEPVRQPSIGDCAIVGGLCAFALFLVSVVLADAGLHAVADLLATLAVPAFFLIWVGSWLLVDFASRIKDDD